MNAEHDFGTWLRQARADYDLTQEALAERIGCSPQTVRAFETGRRRPSREMAAFYAALSAETRDRTSALVHVRAGATEDHSGSR